MAPREQVAAYLSYLGYADRPAPTLDSLVDLHRRHLARVPYENLEIMLGRPPSVDPLDSLARVGRVGRAGYCFHQNGALETVLTDLGFADQPAGGHVWTTPDDRHSGVLNHLVLVADGPAHRRQPRWPLVGRRRARRRVVDPLPLVAGPCGQSGFAYEIDRGP